MTDLILNPFANNGDKTAPPQTDSNNFVNFNLGYTVDYELDLSAGNPAAKAVERQVQNYLFYLLSSNVQDLQKFGLSLWQSGMVGGYVKNAQVMRATGVSTFAAYRSLVDGNVTDPLTNTTGANPPWEVVLSSADTIKSIPMPLGGASGYANQIVTVATDFNTLTNGTWEFASDAITTASANSPKLPGASSSKAGMLEGKQWTVSATVMGVQRYTDTSGNWFTRGSINASWGSWSTGTQTSNFGIDTGTANAVSCNIPLVSATLVDNQVFFAKIAFTNTGAATFTPNASLIPVGLSIVGMANEALTQGELVAGGRAQLFYKADTNNYLLVGCSGAAIQIGQGIADHDAITMYQAKRLVSSSAASRFLSQL